MAQENAQLLPLGIMLGMGTSSSQDRSPCAQSGECLSKGRNVKSRSLSSLHDVTPTIPLGMQLYFSRHRQRSLLTPGTSFLSAHYPSGGL